MAIDAQFRFFGCVRDLEIAKKRRPLQIRKMRAIRLHCSNGFPADKNFQTLAVGKNCGIFARTLRSPRAEIPIKVWFDDRLDCRADLRAVKGGAEFWDPENIRHARTFDSVVRIDEA